MRGKKAEIQAASGSRGYGVAMRPPGAAGPDPLADNAGGLGVFPAPGNGRASEYGAARHNAKEAGPAGPASRNGSVWQPTYSAASSVSTGGVQRSTGWRAARVSSRRLVGA